MNENLLLHFIAELIAVCIPLGGLVWALGHRFGAIELKIVEEAGNTRTVVAVLSGKIDVVSAQLATHIGQDADNFGQLRAQIAGVQSARPARRQRTVAR